MSTPRHLCSNKRKISFVNVLRKQNKVWNKACMMYSYHCDIRRLIFFHFHPKVYIREICSSHSGITDGSLFHGVKHREWFLIFRKIVVISSSRDQRSKNNSYSSLNEEDKQPSVPSPHLHPPAPPPLPPPPPPPPPGPRPKTSFF